MSERDGSPPETGPERLDASATAELAELGGELKQLDPAVYGEMKDILHSIVRSLRARTKRAVVERARIFGPAKVKPRA
jgi:hypothetical protein